MKENSFKEKGVILFTSVLLALMMFSGVYYDMSIGNNTLISFIKSHIFESIILMLLLLISCFVIVRFIYNKFDQYNVRDTKSAGTVRKGTLRCFSRLNYKTLLFYWAVVFACWLPYLIICFPASSIGWDYSWQLLQGSGVVPLSNHHPVLGSLIYGLLYKIGFVICGAYGGLFFTGFFQVLLMSFAIAYGLFTVQRMGTPKGVVYCLLAFTCINPVFAGHAVWLIKDSIYASLIIILLALCHNYRLDNNRLLYPILIGVVGFFATMYRNEAIIVIALLLLAAIVEEFRNKNKKALRRIVVSFVSMLVLFISLKIGFRISGIPSTSAARETMTLFSAQIMDCIKKHPNDVNEQEWAVLQESYDDIEATVLKYDEVNRDPIKTVDMDSERIAEYIKTWFRIGMRHKGDYIDTFLRGTNGYWWLFRDPRLIAHSTPLYAPENDFANTRTRDIHVMSHKWLKNVYQSYGIQTDKTIGELALENNPDIEGIFYVKSSFPNARDSLKKVLDQLKEIPLLQFIFVPGFYFVINIISLGYLFIRKRPIFWQCIPMMIIVIFNFFSPINGYMRYFLPVALSSPLIVGMCFTRMEGALPGEKSNG